MFYSISDNIDDANDISYNGSLEIHEYASLSKLNFIKTFILLHTAK